MNKNTIASFVLSASLMLGAALPAMAATSTSAPARPANPKASTVVSCIKAATTKKNAALKDAKSLAKLSARKAAIKAAQQQFALDRKACK